MNQKSLLNEKEAEVGSPQQPQMDTAAPSATRVESSSEAVTLQSKMKIAAKEFVDLACTLWDALEDPNMEDMTTHIASYRIFEPHVYCTPIGTVLFRLDGEWIWLTRENLNEAFERVSGNTIGLSTVLANEHLDLARAVCKERGRVSWVLPRLGMEEEVAK